MLHRLTFILEAAIAFGFLIFIHELGHFLACKFIKVRVDVFSLGFGPILKAFKWGETEYRLCALPLGGFVKMAGEEPVPDRPPAPGEFYSKSVGQRSIVFVAGVFMNMVSGLLIFIAAYGVGVPVTPGDVGSVVPGSPVWKIGLQPGDKITELNGISSPDFEDIRTTSMLSSADKPIRISYEHDGKIHSAAILPEYNKDLGIQVVGIGMPESLTVDRSVKDEDYLSGLKEGDRLLAVQLFGKDRQKVDSYEEYNRIIAPNNGLPVTIFVSRNGREERVTVNPKVDLNSHWLGIEFGSNKLSAVRGWADTAGLKADDEIIKVGDALTSNSDAVKDAISAAAGKKTVLLVKRGGQEIPIQAEIPLMNPKDAIALSPDTVVNSCFAGLPAAQAGIQPGDRVTSLDGKPVSSVPEMAALLQAAGYRPVRLDWIRDGRPMSRTLSATQKWEVSIPFEIPKVIVKAGLGQSIVLGTRKAFQWTTRVYASIKQLILLRVSYKLISGPITIAKVTYGAAKFGLGTLFYVIGVLSINLGVMNLLPIPVLDGGHLLFAAIEKVRGRPVSDRIRAAATYVGIAFLLSLIVLAVWNDIAMNLGM